MDTAFGGELQVWSHGHAGQVQSAQGLLVERTGFYMRIKAAQAAETWLHYAPASHLSVFGWPVLLGALIEFRTSGSAHLAQVDIWNGANQLASSGGMRATSTIGEPGEGAQFAHGRLMVPLADAPQSDAAIGVSILIRLPLDRSGKSSTDIDTLSIVGVGLEYG
ncbi:DUF6623 family protein [Nocardioides sp. W7]|uniref:DUF6623 family protein n=1 Tax=Nocardioides sp. W7 TaxID=2931390 RepID=UPI001FD0EA92|nr:DUF6623 family protein [Nocardioides sp. W7]